MGKAALGSTVSVVVISWAGVISPCFHDAGRRQSLAGEIRTPARLIQELLCPYVSTVYGHCQLLIQIRASSIFLVTTDWRGLGRSQPQPLQLKRHSGSTEGAPVAGGFARCSQGLAHAAQAVTSGQHRGEQRAERFCFGGGALLGRIIAGDGVGAEASQLHPTGLGRSEGLTGPLSNPAGLKFSH